MKRILHKTLCVTLSASLVWMPVWWHAAKAEDIDLFVSNVAGSPNPNILVIIDNSANWSNAAQHWPNGVKQGQSELRALRTAVNELRPADSTSSQVNLGLMMFTEGQGSDLSGGYIRYAIRPMTQAYVDGLRDIIGDDTCTDGSVAVGTANITKCIYKNFDNTFEKVGTSNTDYSAALFEAYKYFGGYTDVAHAALDVAGVPPTGAVAPHTFGKARRAGTIPTSHSGNEYNKFDRAAYTDDNKGTYNGPITSASSCAKNYIIFIGNGFPASEPTAWDTELLFNVNQATTQQAMPNFTTTVATTNTNLGTLSTCTSAAACPTSAATLFSGLYDSFSCSGGTSGTTSTSSSGDSCLTNAQCVSAGQAANPSALTVTCSGGSSTVTGTATVGVCYTASQCESSGVTASYLPGYTTYSCDNSGSNCTGGARNGRILTGTKSCGTGTLANQTQTMTFGSSCSTGLLSGQTMTGTKTVATVTPTGTFSFPTSSKTRYGDEWTKFLANTDVSEIAGQQTVVTYTIDVFLDAQDADQTALLQSMARYGGGKYFSASSETSILNALREILIEIQSVNTVFAAASLPINATNRSQNENQVFIGMFRPDSGGRPRWFGNLKRYQIALFTGEAKLADADGNEAVSNATGFVAPCSRSFYTVDTGEYWNFIQQGVTSFAGLCTTAGTSLYSDKPDGAQVEKGAVAETLRLGNNPGSTGYTGSATTPTPAIAVGSRSVLTCQNANTTTTYDETLVTCSNAGTAMHAFNNTNIANRNALGSSVTDDTERDNIINFTLGADFSNDQPNQNFNTCGGVQCISDVRPDVHGDVAHSRPLPVNYGGSTGVVLFYGSNDATFRAIKGSTGQELWAFIAPEHHSRLERLRDNSPRIKYSGSTDATLVTKDYFFDGSAGLYQTFNSDGTSNTAWVFPSMRRGGRMLYGFNVTTPDSPRMLWRKGCPQLSSDTGCTTGFDNIGQTWSIPAVAKIKDYNLDASSNPKPVIIVGGGWDTCDDNDDAATICTSPKGSNVYILDAETGNLLKKFGTGGTGTISRSVASDITLVDRSFQGYAQHAYFADTGGSLYRIDFVNPSTQASITDPTNWTLTKIASTSSGNRKFLFAPAVLATSSIVYLTIGSGDRERPLITNYPYVDNVQNRFYMFKDDFGATTNVDLDGTSLTDLTSTNSCSAAIESGDRGWRIDLNAGRGEQTVTSSAIFGGLVFWSTNRPLDSSTTSCANALGEARGYAVNLLNASGAVGTEAICGGDRSNTFVGGGLPPSPVTGTVPVDGKPVTVMIGGVQRTGASSSPIGAQKVKPVIAQKRTRVYWYKHGDK